MTEDDETQMHRALLFAGPVQAKICQSLRNGGLSESGLARVFDWLACAPKWTTIRVNRCRAGVSGRDESLRSLQAFVDESYAGWLELLRVSNPSARLRMPQCRPLNELIDECLVFDSAECLEDAAAPCELPKKAVIDLKCAQAVMRGAHIFLPGVIALSFHARKDDLVSIYADLTGGKCLKGADASLFVAANPDRVRFIGNGSLCVDRDDVFKSSSSLQSGVGVRILQLIDNYYIPSLDLLDERTFYPQNLPSVVCARVLEPREGELIADMCACPGGKTLHIAALVNNKSRVVAFDKIASKVEQMRSLCARMEANCIECHVQDSTKIDFDVYRPGSFDRILVDAPCSALGQRPLIFSNIDLKQLGSYVAYQRAILENAVKLLKPGGVLVYSTCTITVEENEQQVSWLLKKFDGLLRLVDQISPNTRFSMIESLLNQLQTSNHQLKLGLDQGKYMISDYCDKLRYEVYAATESAIQHLNKLGDGLLRTIDTYESELVDSYETRSVVLEKQRLELRELAGRCDRVLEAESESSEREAAELLDEVQAACGWLRHKLIFNGNYIHFVEAEAFYEPANAFGFLKKTATLAIRQPKKSVVSGSYQIKRLATLADGHVAMTLNDGRVQVWNPKDDSVHEFRAHQCTLLSIAALPGNEFATGAFDSSIKVWRLAPELGKSGRVSERVSMRGHTGSINTLTAISNGRELASGSSDGSLRIWSTATGRVVKTLTDSAQTNVICTAVLAGTDPVLVAAAGQGGAILVWDTQSGKVVLRIDSALNGVADLIHLREEGALLSDSLDKSINVWSLMDGSLLRTFKLNAHFFRSIIRLASGELAVGFHDGTVRVWSPRDGGTTRLTLIGHRYPVSSTALLNDGSLISASTEAELKVWSVA